MQCDREDISIYSETYGIGQIIVTGLPYQSALTDLISC